MEAQASGFMVGLIMFAKVFGRDGAGFHRGDAGGEVIWLRPSCTRARRAILRAQLGQGMTQRIEFLGVDGPGRLRNVFVFLAEGQENPPQFLAAQLIDAGVARKAEKPRLELGRRLQPIQRADHLDEHLLGQILDVIAAVCHGVNKSRHPVLIADNEFPLRIFVTLLGPPYKVSKRRLYS